MFKKKYIPRHIRDKVIIRDKGICQNCGLRGDIQEWKSKNGTHYAVYEYVQAWGRLVSFDMGHIIPESWGGNNTSDNLILMCNSCNKGLGDKLWKGFKTYEMV